MNVRQVDLNLLQIFNAVMAERNVTRAAQRLALTQPAVSNALGRLRVLFQDELFIRVRDGVRPTERAIAIWPDIQDALGKIMTLVGAPEFESTSSHQLFQVAISDSLRYGLVPALAVHLAREAPQVKLHLHPHTETAAVELEAGRLDCVLGMFPQPAPGLHVDALFADDFICVMRKGNPLAQHCLTLKSFAAASHALVKSDGIGQGVVDAWLGLKGLTRQIPLVVNHYDDALTIVEQTDLVTTIPRRLAWLVDRIECRIVKLPFATERILYKMLWHDRTDRDPARIWLRAVIRAQVMEAAWCKEDAFIGA
ncbi:MAG: LysR family transcriptional regulator [Holophaga sp.]|nr:LysR family transcriptional regulator [Holophaga sp.]